MAEYNSTDTTSFVYQRFTEVMKNSIIRLSFLNKQTNFNHELVDAVAELYVPVKVKDLSKEQKHQLYEKKRDSINGKSLNELRKEAQHTLFSGAYMNLFLLWEGFVQDFLEETFRRLIECITEHDQPPKKAIDLLRNAYRWKTQVKSATEVAVDLSKNPKMWQSDLRDYSEERMRIGSCIPIFAKSNADSDADSESTQNADSESTQNAGISQTAGNKKPRAAKSKKPKAEGLNNKPNSGIGIAFDISNYFKRLFWCDLTGLVSTFTPISFECFTNASDEKFPLCIENKEALEKITLLIYGFRCILSHSNCTKTFESGGALHNFPLKDSFTQLMGEKSHEKVVKQFYRLHEKAEEAKRAQEKKKEKGLYYPLFCDIVNLHHFIVAMVHRLHNTVARLIREKYEIKIWEEKDPLIFKWVSKQVIQSSPQLHAAAQPVPVPVPVVQTVPVPVYGTDSASAMHKVQKITPKT